ncbi:MAG: TonB-dependent receptor [Sphingomonadales bacterium]|nr:TonB-dependent receptor [Sphingomonadales bacterium]
MAALAISDVAMAEEAAPGDSGTDIVVTAQRRSQSRQDVGIAIAAYGALQLKALNVQSSVDIARLTPGVSLSSNVGGQNSQFSIRGVTQNDFNDAIEAPVAVYVDDGYIPNMQGQTFGLFDLQRVEVLKGPQGTLFGRNATGGLVQYVVNKPGDQLDAYVNAQYGRYNQVKVDGAIGGPLTDTLSARASFFYNRNDATLKNVYPAGAAGGVPVNLGRAPSPCCQDEGNEDTLAGRLQLQFKPSSDLTIRLVGAVARQHLSTGPYQQEATVAVVDAAGNVVNSITAAPTETRTAIGPNGANFTGFAGSPPSRLAGADWFGFTAPDPAARTVSVGYAKSDANWTDSYNGALHIDYDFAGMHLVSISDFKSFDKSFVMDVAASPTSFVEYGTLAHTKSFSQELRLSGKSAGLEWTVGGYYLNVNAKASDGFLAPAYSIFSGIFGAPTTGIQLINTFRLKTISASLFGQVEYEFVPAWKIIVGGRIIREHQEYDFASAATANLDPYMVNPVTAASSLFTLQPSFNDKRTATLWTGKAQLEYHPSSSLLIYAGVNRGVKGGSYNAKLPDGTPPLPAAQIPYKPEVLLSYEGGFKITLPNGLGTFNASAYYYSYSDYQAFTFQNVSGVVQNRDARTYGAEVELALRPAEGLQVNLSASAFNAKVKNLQIAPGVFRDVRPSFAPRTQVAGRISYKLPMAVLGGSLTLNGDGSYTSGSYNNLQNFAAQWMPGYELFNASIAWKDKSERISVGAFVSNIGNKLYKVSGYDLSNLCGCSEEVYGKPRWWGLTLGYSFR